MAKNPGSQSKQHKNSLERRQESPARGGEELAPPCVLPGFIGRLRADLRAARWTEAYLEWLFDDDVRGALTEENLALSRHEAARFAQGPAALLTRIFLLGDKLSDKELALALPRLGVRGALKLGLVRAVNDQGTRFRANCQLMPHRCPLDFQPDSALAPASVPEIPVSSSETPASASASASSPTPVVAPTAFAVAPVETAVTSSPASPEATSVADPAPYVDPYSLLPAGHGLAPGEGPRIEEGPGQDWWLASDLPGSVLGGQLPREHVLGVGGASRSLLRFTLRTPQASALDLGTGCGIQALYLAQHCARVTATDVSERALAFARFNAALAGPETEGRIEFLAGSFLDPVASRKFELIVSNPPFVITPPRRREGGLMEYRDGNRSGDGVMAFLFKALPEHLEAGGVAQLIGNWECAEEAHWADKLRLWASQASVNIDVVAALREQIRPREYAAMWLRDEGLDVRTRRRDWEVSQKEWVNYFDSRGVEAVSFGYLVLRRLAEAPAALPGASSDQSEYAAFRPGSSAAGLPQSGESAEQSPALQSVSTSDDMLSPRPEEPAESLSEQPGSPASASCALRPSASSGQTDSPSPVSCSTDSSSPASVAPYPETPACSEPADPSRPARAGGQWYLDARGSGVSADGKLVATQLNALTLLGSDDLFDLHFCLASDVSEQRFYMPGQDTPTALRLVQGNGWGLAVDVDALLAGIVGACDGELSLGQISDAVASLAALEPGELRAQVREPLLELIKRGFLEV